MLNNKNILARWFIRRNVHLNDMTLRNKILTQKLENIYGLKNEQLEAEIMFYRDERKSNEHKI